MATSDTARVNPVRPQIRTDAGETSDPVALWPEPAAGVARPVTLGLGPRLAAQSVRRGTLLIISTDDTLTADVRQAITDEELFSVVIAESARAVAEQANHAALAAGWVDLDLPGDAGWNAAEWLLGRTPTVRLLLLTSRGDQLESAEGILSETVFEKALGATRLIQKTMLLLNEASDQIDRRITRQRVWLRWARPYRWPDTAPMNYRHWGINE